MEVSLRKFHPPELALSSSVSRKHVLRHEKPWKCGVPNCKRQQEGFSTKNDLDRHKKSVHAVLPDGLTNDKTYICAAAKCAKKNKVWPRADNFKQHCDRVHKKDGYDVDDLMNKSVIADARNDPRCKDHFNSDCQIS